MQAPSHRAWIPGRRASEDECPCPLGTHRPKRVDVWHPTIAPARRTALSPRAASVQWHPLSGRTPLPFALHSRPERRACSGTRAKGGGIDRRRSGRRSMARCKGERTPLPFALHSLPERRACSGIRAKGGGIDRRRSGRRSMARCKGERTPLPFALHSLPERRACSGTHFRVVHPCPSHCTLAQSGERAVAPARCRLKRRYSVTAVSRPVPAQARTAASSAARGSPRRRRSSATGVSKPRVSSAAW